MIVTRLVGGLGNQMFQYAFGLQLAKQTSQSLYVDLKAFETYRLHSIAINHLNISACELPNVLQKRVPGRYRNQSRAREALSSVVGRWASSASGPLPLRREKPFGFRAEYLSEAEDLYLDGYWQSEQFFVGVQDEIRKEFSLKATLSDKSAQIADRMRDRPSVAVHVRRGDYVNDPETARIYRSLDASYYRSCLNDLQDRVENLQVYLFSNDIPWCMQELDVGLNFLPVTHNDAPTAYEDMYLISQCRHAIIANSSFSWWGAYLGQPDTRRRVYYPSPWFNPGTLEGSSIGAYSWISETDIQKLGVSMVA